MLVPLVCVIHIIFKISKSSFDNNLNQFDYVSFFGVLHPHKYKHAMVSSPYMMYFDIRFMWPGHRIRRWQRRLIHQVSAFSSTAVLVTLSLHVMREYAVDSGDVSASHAGFLPRICRSDFATVKHTKDECLEYIYFGAQGQISVVPYALA